MSIVTDLGLLTAAEGIRANSFAVLSVVGLFVNDYTPTATSILGDLVEPEGSWYERLECIDFSDAVLNAQGKALTVSGIRTWTLVGAGTADVWGWFLLDDSGQLVLLGRFTTSPLTLVEFVPFALQIPYTVGRDVPAP